MARIGGYGVCGGGGSWRRGMSVCMPMSRWVCVRVNGYGDVIRCEQMDVRDEYVDGGTCVCV